MLSIRQKPRMSDDFVRIRSDDRERISCRTRHLVHSLAKIRHKQDGAVAVPASTCFTRASISDENYRSTRCFQ